MVQCLCLVMFSLSWQWCTQCYYSTLWRHEKKKKSSWIRINRFCWAYLKKKKKKKHLVSLFQFSPYIGAKPRIKAWDSFLRSRETMFFLFLLMSPSYYSDQHPKETCPKLYHNVCPLLFVNGKITFNLGNWKLGPPTAYLDKPNPSNHSRWKQVLICLSFTLFSWNLAMIWKNTKLEKFFCLLWLKVESLLTYTSVHFSTTLQQG